MSSTTFLKIKQLRLKGSIPEKFTMANICKASRSLDRKTISSFLPRHATGNIQRGEKYFERVGAGTYRIKKGYLKG